MVTRILGSAQMNKRYTHNAGTFEPKLLQKYNLEAHEDELGTDEFNNMHTNTHTHTHTDTHTHKHTHTHKTNFYLHNQATITRRRDAPRERRYPKTIK